ncbi:unnamed protein product [Rotaria socialis]|uniref:ADP-ribosylglycohydrolase n=1 Tax=Rotaria socialis TaxID=392032 RepID=A0A819V955_9BILA|nr:unnamed protein product [Rotaria socialis]CAF4105388.1 unnamed protein product [Rotaria socialis]
MEKHHNPFKWLREHFIRPNRSTSYPSCLFETEKRWLNLQFHKNGQIKKPDELENEMQEPPDPIDEKRLNQTYGSLIGLALGDALGAHAEFRPHAYLLTNPVTDLEGGGTWGLSKGQFTDDTSMALCLASSLVTRRAFVPYDQLVRYKWWQQHGYMSSTGRCFDIGEATSQSLNEFTRRQKVFSRKHRIPVNRLDYLSDRSLIQKFQVHCSIPGVAGNGALMRLAPLPLFFYKHFQEAIEYSGYSGQITHGDIKAYDACRYYGALIYAALNGYTKDELLDKNFYDKHRFWFGEKTLCAEVRSIAEGSYQKKNGYAGGIRGKGYIVSALEAALWAFWSDEDCFENGVLAAVNLGDDTDTTAAIYGQLAGAYYGYEGLPKKWTEQVYSKRFILNLSKWIVYEGDRWKKTDVILPSDKSFVGAAYLIPLIEQRCEESAENMVLNSLDLGSRTVSLRKRPPMYRSVQGFENFNQNLREDEYKFSQSNLNGFYSPSQMKKTRAPPTARVDDINLLSTRKQQQSRESAEDKMNAAN